MKRPLLPFAISLMLVVASTGAYGADELLTGSVRDVVAQQEEMQRDMQAGRRGWDAVRPEQQAEVARNQKIVLDLLRDRSSFDELDSRQQLDVVNALEVVNAIAMDAEDERAVCRRERKVGSNQMVRMCTTMGQIKRDRAQSRQGIEQAGQLSRQPSALTTQGGR